MGTYRFGTSNIPLSYSEQELEKKVLSLIDKMPTSFTFQTFCNQLLQEADNEGKLRKEPDTEYSTIHLTTDEVQAISKILWNQILGRKLYTIFNAYPYGRESQETLFSKL